MIRVTQFLHGHFYSARNEGSNETFLSGVSGYFLLFGFLEDSEWLKCVPVKRLPVCFIAAKVETLTKVWSTGFVLKCTSVPVGNNFFITKEEKAMSARFYDYFIQNINSTMINGVF